MKAVLREYQVYLEIDRSAAPRTVYDRLWHLGLFFHWVKKDCSSVTNNDLRNYVYYLLKKKRLSPVSVNAAIASLNLFFFHFATPRGYLDCPILTPLTGLKVPHKLPIIPARRQVERFLDYKRKVDSRWYLNRNAQANYDLAIKLLIFTGMRRNELAGLTVGDVKLWDDVPYIHIHNAKNSRERKIPIPSRLIEPLRIHVSELPPNSPVFKNCKGTPMTGIQINLEIKKRAKDLGIPDLTCHKFRHYFVTDLVKKDLNLSKITRISGHSLRVMNDVYTHLAHDDLKDTINAFGVPVKPKEDKIVIVERIAREEPKPLLPDLHELPLPH